MGAFGIGKTNSTTFFGSTLLITDVVAGKVAIRCPSNFATISVLPVEFVTLFLIIFSALVQAIQFQNVRLRKTTKQNDIILTFSFVNIA